MTGKTLSYNDLNPDLVKEFEAAMEQLVGGTQALCVQFAHDMAQVTQNESYDEHERAFVATAGVRVMERLAYYIWIEYVHSRMSPDVRAIFNSMYPDHIIIMEAER